MKKLNKLVLNNAREMTAPEMKDIAGGKRDSYCDSSIVCSESTCYDSSFNEGTCQRAKISDTNSGCFCDTGM